MLRGLRDRVPWPPRSPSEVRSPHALEVLLMSSMPRRGSFLARHRVTIVIALVVALASSATAAAVSYLALGAISTASTTTTLKSAVNGTVLQITNTNTTGGTSARGLKIIVPAGREPISVNATAGKAKNLDADKLDGLDSTQFARGTNVTTIADRLVLADGESGITLLAFGALGDLTGSCGSGGDSASINWTNSTLGSIDVWTNNFGDGHRRGFVSPAATQYIVATWNTTDGFETGDELVLGRGLSPGARQTATVTMAAYRAAAGAPSCEFQATATIWTTP